MGRYKDGWYIASLVGLCAIALLANTLIITGGDASPVDAGSTINPTPAIATGTPAPQADPVTLDFARTLHLGAIRDALTTYYEANGAFPETGGAITTFCARRIDAGCAIREVDSSLAFNDGQSPYWYMSDGQTYTLFAKASLPQPNQAPCPAPLPEELSSGPVICMFDGGG